MRRCWFPQLFSWSLRWPKWRSIIIVEEVWGRRHIRILVKLRRSHLSKLVWIFSHSDLVAKGNWSIQFTLVRAGHLVFQKLLGFFPVGLSLTRFFGWLGSPLSLFFIWCQNLTLFYRGLLLNSVCIHIFVRAVLFHLLQRTLVYRLLSLTLRENFWRNRFETFSQFLVRDFAISIQI